MPLSPHSPLTTFAVEAPEGIPLEKMHLPPVRKVLGRTLLKHEAKTFHCVTFIGEFVKQPDREKNGMMMEGPWIPPVVEKTTGREFSYIVNAMARGLLDQLKQEHGTYIGVPLVIYKGEKVEGKNYSNVQIAVEEVAEETVAEHVA